MDGIVLVNKPKGVTSRNVVDSVGKILNTKKIGHTGTLDPLATGVLILTVNKATKIGELLTNYYKEYVAEVVLGLKTDTLDITGNILEEQKIHISEEQIVQVLNKMIGSYEQEVPIYSAVKIKGKKLYEYAREGVHVDLPKRIVTIKSLELISDVIYENDKTIFKIKCLVSKGTYIRSLINDIAINLGTIGIMKNLTRTKQGNFRIEDCLEIEKIDSSKIIPLEQCLNGYFKVEVDEELFNRIKNGQIIKNIYHEETIVFIYKQKVVAIYQKYDDDKIKPWKMFV